MSYTQRYHIKLIEMQLLYSFNETQKRYPNLEFQDLIYNLLVSDNILIAANYPKPSDLFFQKETFFKCKSFFNNCVAIINYLMKLFFDFVNQETKSLACLNIDTEIQKLNINFQQKQDVRTYYNKSDLALKLFVCNNNKEKYSISLHLFTSLECCLYFTIFDFISFYYKNNEKMLNYENVVFYQKNLLYLFYSIEIKTVWLEKINLHLNKLDENLNSTQINLNVYFKNQKLNLNKQYILLQKIYTLIAKFDVQVPFYILYSNFN